MGYCSCLFVIRSLHFCIECSDFVNYKLLRHYMAMAKRRYAVPTSINDLCTYLAYSEYMHSDVI